MSAIPQVAHESPEPLTVGQMFEKIEAVVERLRRFSKTTLILMLANSTVSDAWTLHGGTVEAIDRAVSVLMDDLDAWTKVARTVNTTRRLKTMLARFDEIDAAIRDGRPIPLTRRKRKARRRAKR